MAKQGAVLVLDAGNALFPAADGATDAQKQKAQLLVEVMGQLGTTMAVGARDLAAGLKFLETAASAHKLRVLSANLTRAGAKGKRPFPASAIVTAGGARVGIIGLSPPGTFSSAPELIGTPPVAAGIAEAKKLRGKVDVVVMLASIPIADALELSKDGAGLVDLIYQSSERRPPTGSLSGGGAAVFGTGDQGKVLVETELGLGGSGPLLDVTDIPRDEQTLHVLQSQRDQAKQRLASAQQPADQKSLQAALAGFEERIKSVSKDLERLRSPNGRTLKTTAVLLSVSLPADPALEAKVAQLEQKK